MTCGPSKSEGPRRKGTQVNRKIFDGNMIGLGIGATAFALTLASGAALAGSPGGRGHFGRGIRAAMATLDLTDAQREKVRAVFTSRKEQFQAFRAGAKANREALKAAASADSPDPAAVGAAFLKVRADGKAMKAQLESVHAEINRILTQEQKAKLDGWIAAHRQQRRAAMRAFGGPPANLPKGKKRFFEWVSGHGASAIRRGNRGRPGVSHPSKKIFSSLFLRESPFPLLRQRG